MELHTGDYLVLGCVLAAIFLAAQVGRIGDAVGRAVDRLRGR